MSLFLKAMTGSILFSRYRQARSPGRRQAVSRLFQDMSQKLERRMPFAPLAKLTVVSFPAPKSLLTRLYSDPSHRKPRHPPQLPLESADWGRPPADWSHQGIPTRLQGT